MSKKTFQRASRRLLASMGEQSDLEKHSSGDVIEGCWVHISRDIEFQSSGQTETTERRTEAEMLVEEVGDLRKRDRIHTEDSTWLVESKISNDGFTVKVVVSESDE